MITKLRTCAALAAAILEVSLCVTPASAYDRASASAEGLAPVSALSPDCVLQIWDLCSGHAWVYSDDEHAVWGTVLDPADCEGECPTGGAVKEVLLFSNCLNPPGTISGIRIQSVDATNCPTELLYQSGPIEITHCTTGDRWTTVPIPLVHVSGQRFVVQVEWGPSGSLQLYSDNTLKNWACAMYGDPIYCAGGYHCFDWEEFPPERSFIYVTDQDGDGTLEDLCGLYGAPQALAFPYIYPFGDLPNNLLISAVLDCQLPTGVEQSSWGRVKSLYR